MPNQFTNYIHLLAESVSGETAKPVRDDNWELDMFWCIQEERRKFWSSRRDANQLKDKAIYDA